ncbi:hypothetical protein [Niabella aurantiaca]|uniref:hypothetical protein n=1 Tax=Niabella aurantiaca TaxID=379900 RepID=UPI00037F54DE|nr:hypothetical protein [Niabella aurantiaca]
MPKDLYNAGDILKILLKDVEVMSTSVCFTGNAIALLNAYAKSGAAIHLDDWDWYKEIRGGSSYYIVTDVKKEVTQPNVTSRKTPA